MHRSEQWTGRVLSRLEAVFVVLTAGATLAFAVILFVLLVSR